MDDSKIVEEIREILWPGGDLDQEWDAETVERIAEVLEENGKGAAS